MAFFEKSAGGMSAAVKTNQFIEKYAVFLTVMNVGRTLPRRRGTIFVDIRFNICPEPPFFDG
ncbi:MAG: hypothetical protein Ct9H300mP25_07220 [Acidobacteriota bacterium]|nr:MAG: hypothetical protein Ct9H300mP25_07220 [Acidobacteriota bacterium]